MCASIRKVRDAVCAPANGCTDCAPAHGCMHSRRASMHAHMCRGDITGVDDCAGQQGSSSVVEVNLLAASPRLLSGPIHVDQ